MGDGAVSAPANGAGNAYQASNPADSSSAYLEADLEFANALNQQNGGSQVYGGGTKPPTVLYAQKTAGSKSQAPTQGSGSSAPGKGASTSTTDAKTADAGVRDPILGEDTTGLKPGEPISAKRTTKEDIANPKAEMTFDFSKQITKDQAAAILFQGGKVPDGATLTQGKGNQWTVQYRNNIYAKEDVVTHMNSHTETVLTRSKLPGEMFYPEPDVTYSWVGGAKAFSIKAPAAPAVKPSTPSSQRDYDDVHVHWGASGYYDENGNWRGGGYDTEHRTPEVRDAMVSYLQSLPAKTNVNLFPVPQSCEHGDLYYLETEQTGKVLSEDVRVERKGDKIFVVVDEPGISSKEKEIKRPYGEKPRHVPSRILVKPGKYDVDELDKTGNLKKYILDNHKDSVKLYFRGQNELGYDGRTREYDTWSLIADIGSGKYRDKDGKPVDPKLVDHVTLGMISGDPSSPHAGLMMYESLRLANQLDPAGKTLHISGAGETTWEKEGVRDMLKPGHVPQVGLNAANKSFFDVINKIGGVAVIHCDVGISPKAQDGIITAQTNYVHSNDIKKMFSAYTSPIAGRGGKIIWAHGGGLARTQLPGDQHINLLREVLRDYPNVYIDLSWDVVAEHIATGEGDKEARMKAWAKLVHDYPDRFIYGSDSVGNPDAHAAESTLRVYESSGFLKALDEMDKKSGRNYSTADRFLHGNYEDVVLGAAKNVTAWRLANGKFLEDQHREYERLNAKP
jgi:hypothetical protein